jgi:hypothetical protein
VRVLEYLQKLLSANGGQGSVGSHVGLIGNEIPISRFRNICVCIPLPLIIFWEQPRERDRLLNAVPRYEGYSSIKQIPC